MNEDKSPTVLIVEDHPLLAELVCDALSEHSLSGQVATSAQDGLGALEKYPGLRIALVDYRLKGEVDGLEFISRARRSKPDIHYVLMTGTPQAHIPDLPRGIELLPKPFPLSKLIELVTRGAKKV